jgi:cysteine-rich repeat protein
MKKHNIFFPATLFTALLLLSGSIQAIVLCGDGVLDMSAGEQCDDGNTIDGDGCSATCLLEPMCGDGVLDEGEACDDGNNVNGDGCSASCTIEAYCGDGVLDIGESCDDGNNIDGDGCSSECGIEPYCGDGNLDPGEQCDDGNNENGDGCSALCEKEVDGGEGCTPGYWKQGHHFEAWNMYSPDMLFSDVFEDAFPGLTLLDVLQQGGGKLYALGRHTVAALLNAASTGVNYGHTPASIVDRFNAVYPGSKDDYEALKAEMEYDNERVCPLSAESIGNGQSRGNWESRGNGGACGNREPRGRSDDRGGPDAKFGNGNRRS